MRDGHGRCIGVSRTGLASLHATTLLHWRSGCHDLFVLGLVARGAHPGRRSPSDRLGKWSGAHMRSAIPRRLRDGAVEQGLTRPCCCICAQAEASPHPGKGASSCSAGELRIIRSSSEALASGPKLVQRTIERSHLLRREPSSEARTTSKALLTGGTARGGLVGLPSGVARNRCGLFWGSIARREGGIRRRTTPSAGLAEKVQSSQSNAFSWCVFTGV